MAEERPLAVITGASTGIGLELAKICAQDGYDLVVAADEPEIHSAARELNSGSRVEAVEADLSTLEGVDALYAEVQKLGRPVDALFANAGRGLGKGFLDQDFGDIRKVIDTNVTGTLYLIQKIGRDMRSRNAGKILITGSIAGYMPGSFQAVYNGTKALLDNFSYALRNELKDTDITVTCLMPGPTETDFFRRADMLDTQVGQQDKDDAAMVARKGYDALMKGQGEVVSGFSNKMQSTMANVMPPDTLAEQHRKMAEPGSGSH